jgi:hypothetical protein
MLLSGHYLNSQLTDQGSEPASGWEYLNVADQSIALTPNDRYAAEAAFQVNSLSGRHRPEAALGG